MRDIILSLFKYYYDTRRIVKRITIKQDKGGQIVMIHPTLFAVEASLWKWGTTDIPDIDKADEVQEKERIRVGNLLYSMAINALENQDKRIDFEREYGRHNINKSNDADLIDYSQRAFYYLKILTPYEYDTSEPEFDEEGILLGFKQLPKRKIIDEDISPYIDENTREDV